MRILTRRPQQVRRPARPPPAETRFVHLLARAGCSRRNSKRPPWHSLPLSTVTVVHGAPAPFFLHIIAHLLQPHRADLLPFVSVSPLLPDGAVRGACPRSHTLPGNRRGWSSGRPPLGVHLRGLQLLCPLGHQGGPPGSQCLSPSRTPSPQQSVPAGHRAQVPFRVAVGKHAWPISGF